MGCFGITLYLVVATLMFDYAFEYFFGKDIPWYLDLLGAVALNGSVFFIWVAALIMNAMGIPTPFQI